MFEAKSASVPTGTAWRVIFLFSLFLQELPPELLPMSENLTEEREIHLSPAGVRQRSLKTWLCSVTIPLCSVRWPHSQPLFTTFHTVLSHYKIRNVQKRTATMAYPMSHCSLELSHYSCSHLTLQSGRRWQPFATAGVGNDVLRQLPEGRATPTFCGTSFLLYNAFGIFRLRPPHTNFFVRSASLHYYLAISLHRSSIEGIR